MKKFALFMMMATIITACGSKNQPDTDDEEQEVALTAEDSAAVIKYIDDSIAAEIASIPMPIAREAIAEDADDEAKAEYDMAMYEYHARLEQYCHDTVAIYATREARVAAALTEALEAKKAGEEKMDSTEQK